MKRLILVVIVVFILNPVVWAQPVYFADPDLKAVVEEALGVTNPTAADMLGLTELSASGSTIDDLTGLQYATNMEQLSLNNNQISDLSPLSGLTNLGYLYLSNNQINNISPLSGLTNLGYLYLSNNQISNISPLAGLTRLLGLGLNYNQISDISPLSGLTNLELLNLSYNQISDISPFAGRYFYQLNLENNPLNPDAFDIYIPQMEAYITSLRYGPTTMVPYVISMSENNAVSEINSAELGASSSYQYSNTVPAGRVISQEPVAGKTVGVGYIMQLVVSLGPPAIDFVEVPDVVGMNANEADSAIISAGLKVSHTHPDEHSDTVPEGHVIRQSPSAGTSVAEGSYVELTISRGPRSGDGPSGGGTVLNGLMAHWKLDEGTGYWAEDSSGKNHRGSAQSRPTWVDGPPGHGTAMYFDGSDQARAWVDCGTWNPSEKTKQLTVALWARWDGPNGNNQGLIAKSNRYDIEDMMWTLGIDKDNHWILFSSFGIYPWCGGIVLPEGQWAHVAASFDGTTMIFYVDGRETGRGAFSFGYGTDATIVFGCAEREGWNGFHGALDDIQIYDRALNAQEIGSLLVDTMTPYVPSNNGLVAYYALEDDAHDSSDNELHGALVGNPSFVEGQVGRALQLDGVNDYVNLGDDPLFDITEQVTLALWVNTQDIGNGQDNPWLGKGDTSYMIKSFRTGNQIEFFVYDGGYHHMAYANVGNAFNDAWHHAVGTYDGKQLKVYVDGELYGTLDYVGGIASNNYNAAIGTNTQAPGRFSEAIVDEAVIYNRALPLNEIRNLAGLPVLSDYTNLLDNGGFEDGILEPWGIYDNIGGGATGEIVQDDPVEGSYCLHVVVPSVGVNFWDKGLGQGGYAFEKGKKYTLSVFLKCREGTMRINFKPELMQSPWTGYGEKIVTMTDEWAEYSITTPVMTEDVNPANITFHIGFSPGDFWIDGVRFYEGDYVQPGL